MPHHLSSFLLLVLGSLTLRSGLPSTMAASARQATPVEFTRDIQPLLNTKCVACHGGVKEAGGVSFLFREQVLGKGKSGMPVVVPGKPEASEMMKRVLSTDPEEIMPKPEHGPALSPEEIALLGRWITEGAQWGEHWAFMAPSKKPAPAVKNPQWPQQPWDRFLLAKLESKGWQPNAMATPAEWLRRASLDLIGLPPTLAELDHFETAAQKDLAAAKSKETDRLLASTHFGERWASVWMDLARYADSEGLGVDANRDVWKYRDWLIDAFNADLPFDQFTIQQLAGDLLPSSTLEQKVATTFHRLSQCNGEGGTDDEEFRVQAVMDRTATTWETWQGLTFGCVQCHSHPYDPIKHDEYYKFLAFFNNSQDADLNDHSPTLRVPLNKADYPAANKLQDNLLSLEKQIHDSWAPVAAKAEWKPIAQLTAASAQGDMQTVSDHGFAEFHASGNTRPNATYTLTIPASQIPAGTTALQLTHLPKDIAKAARDAEWGAILKGITAKISSPTPKPVKFVRIVPEEAHPKADPQLTLSGKGGDWFTFSKFFRPTTAVFILETPLTLTSGETLEITLQNGGNYLASFPMIMKRGRLAASTAPEWLSHAQSPALAALEAEKATARQNLGKLKTTTTPILRDRPATKARLTSLFVRGNWLDKGDLIEQADTPKLFPPIPGAPKAPNRLDLAKWMASPENPLTARVIVNRLWLELFGIGIVPTPEDFGSSGEKPTHPELLDTLAVDFTKELKWSVKALLRQLVTSAAYGQASAVKPEIAKEDPDNRFLARGPRQRLTGEMTRDAMLSISGLIHHEIGGPPTFPPLPPGVWSPFVDKDRWKTPKAGDPQRYRRAVYTYWKRSIPYPTFATFDAPSRETCNKRRIVSNTPLQALTTLNDPAFHECCQGLARLMKRDLTAPLETRIAQAYATATSRQVSQEKLKELTTLYHKLEDHYTKNPKEKGNMAGTPDGAALTVLASVLLNLDETLTR